MEIPTDRSPLTRRGLLAGAGAAATATAGCVGLLNRTAPPERQRVELVVRALPPDSDPIGAQIATRLVEALSAVGIDSQLRPTAIDTLPQKTLYDREFDIYVGQFPYASPPDPDKLYPLLHSRFSNELGWQNPFGSTDPTTDELLTAQRQQTGETRRETVDELQHHLAQTQPFVPVLLPDIAVGVRTNRFTGWEAALARMPHGLLRLSPVDGASELRVTSADSRLTTDWNPISAAHHPDRSLLGLLYDPLLRVDGDQQRPWLATDVSWSEEPLAATIELREGLRWHDGERLTAADVDFTYRFLSDTSLDSAPSPVPAPRYRGASSLVSDRTVSGPRQLTLEFTDTTRSVAERALRLPILPAHIWRERSESVSVAGIEVDATITEALVTANEQPVGSGPLQFTDSDSTDGFRLSRFDDHFLTTTDDDRLAAYHGPPPFAELRVRSATSHGSAVELLVADNVDVTLPPIAPESVDEIDAETDIDTHSIRSHALYHLGFNTRQEPLSNPTFRRLLARLIDKASLAAAVEGVGEPVASPLDGTDWLAPDLDWRAEGDPAVPFFGSDDELDAEAAREAFREAGFQYNDEGELLVTSS